MSKLDEKIERYTKACGELGLDVSAELVEKVTRGLGPSIYNKDAESVSCSDASELERVRENFLKKKLGLSEDDATLDGAIKEVCEAMGTSNRNKYRALFYALLVKKFGKESVYA
ncbi:DUF2853 family protein [Hydrogenimonas urashimensis]|uniref:DUF2853 family protein n=1 Tax=Hydrogenimonas urashimensis TaxID=2740515 RepID=UPI001916374E|nr:DUF2853 family protein [Hydrogenimonas urashimensis]